MTANERASAPVRIIYKPWGVIAGVAGGIVAGRVFKQIWRLVRERTRLLVRPIRRAAGLKPRWRPPSKARSSAESKPWWIGGRQAASRRPPERGRPDPVEPLDITERWPRRSRADARFKHHDHCA